ncbi:MULTISPECIES: PAS domain S-box protein [unclassified Thioalkalivibrio]|uniref:PAS domain S-box protein n=1 Tax=unclassified Thioalkalivibrio TaxID=2621013 RepID=UPI000373590E|nr:MULTISPECIES: PAS domain S-box protein [unclassified Thioalkalivibrio]
MERGLATLALALLAVAGNYFHLPLLFGLDFIFGSIAVMLAVLLLGTLPAVIVAIAGGLYTLVLWGVPYPMVVFVIEALVVGLVYRRWLYNVVVADLLYWVVIGVPLVLLSYRGLIGMDWEPTTMIALKQAVNALFNTLIASLLVMLWRLSGRGAQASRLGRPSLASLLFHAMLPVTLLAGLVPILHEGYQQRDGHEAFMVERLQERAENLSERLATDYREGRVRYDYHLGRVQTREDLGLAIVSPEGRVLASRGEVRSVLEASDGQVEPRDRELSIWLPGGSMSAVGRWGQGSYFVDAPVGPVPDVGQVYAEMPAAPVVRALEHQRVELFALLTVIVALAIVVSAALSYAISRPLRKLDAVSAGLGSDIAAGRAPVLPESRIFEYDGLAGTLREMSRQLVASFRQQAQARSELESEVQARTAELAQTADQLQAVLAAASEFAIVVTDRDGLITLFNPGAEKMTGYAADEMVGQQSPALFHVPEEIAARAAQLSAASERPIEGFQVFTEVADREGAETREWTFVRKGGMRIPVSLTVTPQTDKQGNINGYLGIAEDITERKAAEQAVRESEQRFRDMAEQLSLATEAAGLGIWDLYPATGWLEWDGGMFRLYGADPEGFGHSAEDWRKAVLPEDLDQAEASLEHTLARAGAPNEFVFRIRRGDGATRHIRAMARAVTDEEGTVVRVIGVNEDITERKQAERALAEEAHRTQTILDNMVDGIITIDASGIMQSFNPAATRIFGYTADEVLGRNVSMLMPSPHREAHDRYLRVYQQTGVARIIGIGREVEGQRKDGSLFPMELALSEVTQHGQPLYVGMVRDITERKRVERMKNEFVSTVSHELRTPLTSISGSLGMLASGALGELSGKANEMVTIAQRNSQRLTLLINDLLDMEKIAAGKLHFEMRVQPLQPLLEQALESHRGHGAQHDVKLVLDGDASGGAVRVDDQRLLQVIANLLSNAVKFSPPGGTVRVSVQSVSDPTEGVRVSVADDGPGVPDDFREHIFGKFAQADGSDSRAKGGTGLGLAISRELVEHMGGRIGFDSREGAGATFWFELPLAREASADPSSTGPGSAAGRSDR